MPVRILSRLLLLPLMPILLACSANKEQTSTAEVDTLAVTDSPQAEPNSKYEKLQAELQRCQSLGAPGTLVDFKFGDLLSLPKTYFEVHLLDVFRNDELALTFSFVTSEEGLNIYYICMWDKEREPYIEPVGEGSGAKFRIIPKQCRDCFPDQWFVFNEADKAKVRTYFYSGAFETEGFHLVTDYEGAQKQLNTLLIDFESEKNLLQLSYDEASDIITTHLTYLFSGPALKWVHEEITEEGGTGNSRFIKIENGAQTTLLTSIDEPGYFRVTDQDGDHFYQIYPTRFVSPTIVGLANEKIVEFDTELSKHKQAVKDHQADFTPSGSVFEYYPAADKSRKYTVSSQLMGQL